MSQSRKQWISWFRWCLWFGRCVPRIVLIRHADVTYDGGSDPPLNAAGVARAEELPRVLGGAGIQAIFVSEFLRTQQTAAPLAGDLGVVPTMLADPDATVTAIRALPPSSAALVVSHHGQAARYRHRPRGIVATNHRGN